MHFRKQDSYHSSSVSLQHQHHHHHHRLSSSKATGSPVDASPCYTNTHMLTSVYYTLLSSVLLVRLYQMSCCRALVIADLWVLWWYKIWAKAPWNATYTVCIKAIIEFVGYRSGKLTEPKPPEHFCLFFFPPPTTTESQGKKPSCCEGMRRAYGYELWFDCVNTFWLC